MFVLQSAALVSSKKESFPRPYNYSNQPKWLNPTRWADLSPDLQVIVRRIICTYKGPNRKPKKTTTKEKAGLGKK